MSKKGSRGQGSRIEKQKRPPPLVIGLVGGIGSGKSTVAAAMRGLGARVVDADRIAHAGLRDPSVIRRIREHWPAAVRGGRVARAALAREVFARPGALPRLERIVHPRILARMRAALRRHGQAGHTTVIDAPLLLEKGLDRLCDVLVFVEAPRLAVQRRVGRDRGWTPRELRTRQKHQWSIKKKRGACGFRLYNSGGRSSVLRETHRIWSLIHSPTRS
mgnify:CR=1 FL=1